MVPASALLFGIGIGTEWGFAWGAIAFGAGMLALALTGRLRHL